MLIEPPSTQTAVGLVQTAIEAADDGAIVVAGQRYIIDDADDGVVHSPANDISRRSAWRKSSRRAPAPSPAGMSRGSARRVSKSGNSRSMMKRKYPAGSLSTSRTPQGGRAVDEGAAERAVHVAAREPAVGGGRRRCAPRLMNEKARAARQRTRGQIVKSFPPPTLTRHTARRNS
jgi:hypothetical protein